MLTYVETPLCSEWSSAHEQKSPCPNEKTRRLCVHIKDACEVINSAGVKKTYLARQLGKHGLEGVIDIIFRDIAL
jgi:hypothetical protein